MTSPDLLRTPQTRRPSGTYFRRVHRISGYVGSCVLLHPLRSSTLNTLWHGRVLWHIVVYLAGPHLTSSGPDRPGYRPGPTYGGSIGSQGWWDTSSPPHLLLAVHCRMPHSAEHHVAQASSSVLGPSGPDRPRDPLVPAYGGAIGYRGMVDPVPGFAS